MRNWDGAPPLAVTRRRQLLGLATGAVASMAAPAVARGAGFPERPVRLINPWSPGSSSDVQMRSLADIAQRHNFGLVGPAGIQVIVARPHDGAITCRANQWHRDPGSGLKRISALFGQDTIPGYLP